MSNQILNEILDELRSAKEERQNLKSQMNNRFDTLDTKMASLEQEVKEIKTSVKRIEENEPQDIIAMLNNINGKLEEKNYDIVALNKRLFKVESTIERITKQ